MPPRFTLTSAAPSDYTSFARLFPELGVPEAPPSTQRFVEVIAPDAIFVRDGDAVVGYAWSRTRGERLHVVHVITDPAHRRRGVAQTLMDALAERGRKAGLTTWMLNVKPDNLAARALYERCGMSVVGAYTGMRLAWRDVPNLTPMPSVAVVSRQLTPEDDARFEAALTLTRGDIQASRTLPGRVLVGLESSDGPVGFAPFDPTFPGTSGFRLRAPAYARALLEAIRPHTLPEHDHLLVFVEGDPALEATLTAAGAEVVMPLLRMEGSIPA